MAKGFNLTAEINLRGPSNIRQVVSDIRRQLGTIDTNINVTLNAQTNKQISTLDRSFKTFNNTLSQTRTLSDSTARSLSQLGNAAKTLSSSLQTIPQTMTQISQAATKVATDNNKAKVATQQMSTEFAEFGRQSALAVRRFAAFATVTGVIFKVSNAINTATKDFVDFNKALVQVAQVTDAPVSSLDFLVNNITSLSTKLGVASKDLIEVSRTLSQAGLSAKDTSAALEALALSTLAPSFDDLNNTVEGSIALMRQFSIGAGDLGSALGSINAVAAKFAVEAGDIVTAIQRTGGVFANASKGVSEGTDALNEFIAVFTSVRATTRESAETIATGLRTIFTRIQREDTINALKGYGVALTDLEGKFVGPYEAVRRLAQGLSQLDPREIRFSRIVEELGGFRQIGKVIPLIQQFSTAQQALSVAQRGSSSLARDAVTAQLSLANQITKVREEFTALIRSIGQTEGFRDIVRLTLDLTSNLIRIADAAKGALPALTAIFAIKGFQALTQFSTGFLSGIRRGNNRGLSTGGKVLSFSQGGAVPGSGRGDKVPALLEPGEVVMSNRAVDRYGRGNLVRMNKYADGGLQYNQKESTVRAHAIDPKRYGSKITKKEYLALSGKRSIGKKIQSIINGRDLEVIPNFTIALPESFNRAMRRGGSGKIPLPEFKKALDSPYLLYGSNAEKLSGRTKRQGIGNIPAKTVQEIRKAFKAEVDRTAEPPAPGYISRDEQIYRFADIAKSILTREKLWKSRPLEIMSRSSTSTGGTQSRDFVPKMIAQQFKPFKNGGIASRQIGYIDYDVIANPANEAVVSKGMEATGVTGPRLYADYLTNLAVKRRKEAGLEKLRAIYGVAGAGKTTLARGQGTDKASLRETTRFPILSPEDINKASEVIVLSSSVSQKKLDEIFSNVDRAYTLSTTTASEKERIKSQRESRDTTGIGLEGRKPGGTIGIENDTAISEALLSDRLGKKSVVLGRSSSGKLRRKTGNELVEVVKKKIGVAWGGFAPMTLGHESIVDSAKAMGISPEDFLYIVGSNEAIKLGDASSYRTAIFNQDSRVLLAKAGAGAKGATVLPKEKGFEIPLGFDIGESGADRRKVLLPGSGSVAFVGDEKSEEILQKYRDAGYKTKSIGRMGDISGTMVRDLISQGNLGELQKVLSPNVYELISNNIGRIQNRANILPSLIQQVQQSQAVKLADVEKQIKSIGISRIDQKKMGDPEYAAKAETLLELRTLRDKIKSSGSFEPYKLLDKLAADQPEKYGLDFTLSKQTEPKPIRTVGQRQTASLGGLIQKLAEGGTVESIAARDQKSIEAVVLEQLSSFGNASGVKKILGLGAGDREASAILNAGNIKAGKNIEKAIRYINRALAKTGKADAAKEAKEAAMRKVAIAGLFPLDYNKDFSDWKLEDGREIYGYVRGFQSSFLPQIEAMQEANRATRQKFAEDIQDTAALGGLGNRNIQGPIQPLVIDFDETLALGTKMLDENGKEDLPAYSDRKKVMDSLAKARPTSLAKRLASIEQKNPGYVRMFSRILTARPQSTADIITSTLNRFGLPYIEQDVTGVSKGLGTDIAKAKAANVARAEKLIDDSEENIRATMAAGKSTFRYGEVPELKGPAEEKFGQSNIEGGMLEAALSQLLGYPINVDALQRNRAIDFPQGLGRGAQLFGLPPNIETEVKRTLDGDSFSKAREEFSRYFTENPQAYAKGGAATFGSGSFKFPKRISNAYVREMEKLLEQEQMEKVFETYPRNERMIVDEEAVQKGYESPFSRELFINSFKDKISRNTVFERMGQFARVIGLPPTDFLSAIPTQLDFGVNYPATALFNKDPSGPGTRGLQGVDLTPYGYTEQDKQDLFGYTKLIEEKKKQILKTIKTSVTTYEDGSFGYDVALAEKLRVELNDLQKQQRSLIDKNNAAIKAAKESRLQSANQSGRGSVGIATNPFNTSQRQDYSILYHELTHQLFNSLRTKNAKSFEAYKAKVSSLFDGNNDDVADAFDALVGNTGYNSADVAYGRSYKLSGLSSLMMGSAKESFAKYVNSDPEYIPELRKTWAATNSTTTAKAFKPLNPKVNDILLRGQISQDVIDKYEDNGKEEFLTTLIQKLPLLDENLSGVLDSTLNDLLGGAGISRQKFSLGGLARGGSVPALVSNGEAYVPPKLAKRIGYGTLNRMNQADKNGMGQFSDGGISIFKGPGSGTSDSIPTSLPVGSFIIREKATKALGLNRGGSVGIPRFKNGGSPGNLEAEIQKILIELENFKKAIYEGARQAGKTATEAKQQAERAVLAKGSEILSRTSTPTMGPLPKGQTFEKAEQERSQTRSASFEALRRMQDQSPILKSNTAIQVSTSQKITGFFQQILGFSKQTAQAQQDGAKAQQQASNAIQQSSDQLQNTTKKQNKINFGGLGTALAFTGPALASQLGEVIGGATGAGVAGVASNVSTFTSIGSQFGGIGAIGGLLFGLATSIDSWGASIANFEATASAARIDQIFDTTTKAFERLSTNINDKGAFNDVIGNFQRIQNEEVKLAAFREKANAPSTLTSLGRRIGLLSTPTAETVGGEKAISQQKAAAVAQQFLESQIQAEQDYKTVSQKLQQAGSSFDSLYASILEADTAYAVEVEKIKQSTDTEDRKNQKINELTAQKTQEIRTSIETRFADIERAKANKRLTKQLDFVSVSLTRTFTTLNQSINAAAFSLDQASESIQNIVNDSANFSNRLRTSNILENPRAYSRAEQNAAISQSAQFAGGDRQFIEQFARFSLDIEDSMTSALNQARAGGVTDPNVIGDRFGSLLTNQLDSIFGPQLGESIRNQFKTAINELTKGGTKLEDISTQDILDNIPGLNQQVQASKQVFEALNASAKFLENALNFVGASAKEYGSLQDKLAENIASSQNIIAQSNLSLQEALGKRISLSERRQARTSAAAIRAGVRPQDLNANFLSNRRDTLIQQKQNIEKSLDNLSQSFNKRDLAASRQFVELNKQLGLTESSIRQVNQALESLPQNIEQNINDIISEISRLQQKSANITGASTSFGEKLLGSTPQELQELGTTFNILNSALSGNLNTIQQSQAAQLAYRQALDDGKTQQEAMIAAQQAFAGQTRNVLGLFNELSSMSGLEEDELRPIRAQLFKNLASSQGAGLQNNPIFQTIINRLEQPPEESREIRELRNLLQVEQQSLIQSTEIINQNTLDKQTAILDAANKRFIDALNDIEVRFNTEQLRSMGLGLSRPGDIRPPAAPNPAVPQVRAKGGLIYASDGTYVNYQPKGTDTIPAMLSPGEFVVNAQATKNNLGLLRSINSSIGSGKTFSKGGVVYAAGGFNQPLANYDVDIPETRRDVASTPESQQPNGRFSRTRGAVREARAFVNTQGSRFIGGYNPNLSMPGLPRGTDLVRNAANAADSVVAGGVRSVTTNARGIGTQAVVQGGLNYLGVDPNLAQAAGIGTDVARAVYSAPQTASTAYRVGRGATALAVNTGFDTLQTGYEFISNPEAFDEKKRRESEESIGVVEGGLSGLSRPVDTIVRGGYTYASYRQAREDAIEGEKTAQRIQSTTVDFSGTGQWWKTSLGPAAAIFVDEMIRIRLQKEKINQDQTLTSEQKKQQLQNLELQEQGLPKITPADIAYGGTQQQVDQLLSERINIGYTETQKNRQIQYETEQRNREYRAQQVGLPNDASEEDIKSAEKDKENRRIQDIEKRENEKKELGLPSYASETQVAEARKIRDAKEQAKDIEEKIKQELDTDNIPGVGRFKTSSQLRADASDRNFGLPPEVLDSNHFKQWKKLLAEKETIFATIEKLNRDRSVYSDPFSSDTITITSLREANEKELGDYLTAYRQLAEIDGKLAQEYQDGFQSYATANYPNADIFTDVRSMAWDDYDKGIRSKEAEAQKRYKIDKFTEADKQAKMWKTIASISNIKLPSKFENPGKFLTFRSNILDKLKSKFPLSGDPSTDIQTMQQYGLDANIAEAIFKPFDNNQIATVASLIPISANTDPVLRSQVSLLSQASSASINTAKNNAYLLNIIQKNPKVNQKFKTAFIKSVNDINNFNKMVTGYNQLDPTKQNNARANLLKRLTRQGYIDPRDPNGSIDRLNALGGTNVSQFLFPNQQAQNKVIRIAGAKNSGGIVYASGGMLVPYEPKGTDTVPAMLTPGEFVVNKQATARNKGLLESINRSKGGSVKYLADGGLASDTSDKITVGTKDGTSIVRQNPLYATVQDNLRYTKRLDSMAVSTEKTLKGHTRSLEYIGSGVTKLNNRIDSASTTLGVPFSRGGIVYASNGMLVPYQPKDTDTVPAMLTPGEFVVNRQATSKHRGLLESINRNKGGSVKYLANGGPSSDSEVTKVVDGVQITKPSEVLKLSKENLSTSKTLLTNSIKTKEILQNSNNYFISSDKRVNEKLDKILQDNKGLREDTAQEHNKTRRHIEREHFHTKEYIDYAHYGTRDKLVAEHATTRTHITAEDNDTRQYVADQHDNTRKSVADEHKKTRSEIPSHLKISMKARGAETDAHTTIEAMGIKSHVTDEHKLTRNFLLRQQPKNLASGGIVYASNGQLINFQPKGTDTVPAMLTPGEFVVNAKATKNNLDLLHSINNGGKPYSRGGVIHLQDGGLAVDKGDRVAEAYNATLKAYEQPEDAQLTNKKIPIKGGEAQYFPKLDYFALYDRPSGIPDENRISGDSFSRGFRIQVREGIISRSNVPREPSAAVSELGDEELSTIWTINKQDWLSDEAAKRGVDINRGDNRPWKDRVQNPIPTEYPEKWWEKFDEDPELRKNLATLNAAAMGGSSKISPIWDYGRNSRDQVETIRKKIKDYLVAKKIKESVAEDTAMGISESEILTYLERYSSLTDFNSNKSDKDEKLYFWEQWLSRIRLYNRVTGMEEKEGPTIYIPNDQTPKQREDARLAAEARKAEEIRKEEKRKAEATRKRVEDYKTERTRAQRAQDPDAIWKLPGDKEQTTNEWSGKPPQPERRWVSLDEKYATIGTLVAYKDGKASIRKPTGQTIVVDQNKLSEMDQKYLTDLLIKQKTQPLPTPKSRTGPQTLPTPQSQTRQQPLPIPKPQTGPQTKPADKPIPKPQTGPQTKPADRQLPTPRPQTGPQTKPIPEPKTIPQDNSYVWLGGHKINDKPLKGTYINKDSNGVLIQTPEGKNIRVDPYTWNKYSTPEDKAKTMSPSAMSRGGIVYAQFGGLLNDDQSTVDIYNPEAMKSTLDSLTMSLLPYTSNEVGQQRLIMATNQNYGISGIRQSNLPGRASAMFDVQSRNLVFRDRVIRSATAKHEMAHALANSVHAPPTTRDQQFANQMGQFSSEEALRIWEARAQIKKQQYIESGIDRERVEQQYQAEKRLLIQQLGNRRNARNSIVGQMREELYENNYQQLADTSYTLDQLNAMPNELFAVIASIADAPEFGNMPASQAFLKQSMRTLGYSKGGVVYAQDGMLIPNNITAYKSGRGPYSTNTPSRTNAFDTEKVGEDIDSLSTLLSIVGMVPGIGEPFDIAASTLDLARGDYTSAGLGMASALPIAGTAAGMTKIGRRALTPPPLPKPFVKSLPEYGPPKPTDADLWFGDLMQRIQGLEPPQEGTRRLYRLGNVPRDYVAPETANWYGKQIPYAEWVKKMEMAKASSVGADTTPRAAAGKWFTDAPEELDYYVRRDADQLDTLRAYYKDIPISDLQKYSVTPEGGMSKFGVNSANHQREFVLPMADEAQRIKGPMGPSGYAHGGIVYANKGMLIPYQPKGTDTVPAMLTPGEFVINRQATQQNLPLLRAINNGDSAIPYSNGGIAYLRRGGQTSNLSQSYGYAQQFDNISRQLQVFNGILMGANQTLNQFGNTLQQIGVNLQRNNQNIGGGVNNIDGLSRFTSAFNTFITQLSSIRIPEIITMQLAPLPPIQVVITGAEALAAIEPGLQRTISSRINEALSSFANNFDGIDIQQS